MIVFVVVLTAVLAYLTLQVAAAIGRKVLSSKPTLPGTAGVRIVSREVVADMPPARTHDLVMATAADMRVNVAYESPGQVILAPRPGWQPFGSVVSVWFTPSSDSRPDADQTTVLIERRPVAQGIPLESRVGVQNVDAIEAALRQATDESAT